MNTYFYFSSVTRRVKGCIRRVHLTLENNAKLFSLKLGFTFVFQVYIYIPNYIKKIFSNTGYLIMRSLEKISNILYLQELKKNVLYRFHLIVFIQAKFAQPKINHQRQHNSVVFQYLHNILHSPSLSRFRTFLPPHNKIQCSLGRHYPLPGFPRWVSGKESSCQFRRHRRHGFYPCVRKISWSGKWQPTRVFLLGNSLDRGAWGYSP